MSTIKCYEVIIVGGSYSGLAAAMALGRALRKVLVIDSGLPCNSQTPQSHNFLTQDGQPPKEIASLAKQQVSLYDTVEFLNDLAIKGVKTENGFEIQTQSGKLFAAKKLIFATGIKDVMPSIQGVSECWGISVLHCPYCHGYEVRGLATGILVNGDGGFELAKLISNWTKDITLFTQGRATFTPEQMAALLSHNIRLEEKEIQRIEHTEGRIKYIAFKDDSKLEIKALYARLPFIQHCTIPEQLGCILTEDGYLKVDAMQKTSIHGIYACGDNASRMRTVANAVSMGTIAGMMVNKELVEEHFTI
ncbi:MAG: NAD(P)/FAD-dependent oxidoreductase [Saprospiraceae bacterium]|nr:NAD(P)/FAD-dependent oxidoreductase [Saprospiraceae bacterium]